MAKPTTPLVKVAKIIMGQSPPGDTYNRRGEGLPLLNGPTEFGETSPNCTLFTTDSHRECESDDLIFCVRGSTTGRMNWADRKYSLGRGVCNIRGETRQETRFIRYCIEGRLDALLQLAGGGTFPNLSKTDIEEFEIPWPDNRVRIAGILSAYDEFIGNNLRRIRILEEMARSLYREWFVNFRFHGYENTKYVDSPIGPVPRGWEAKKLGELTAFLNRGLSPTYDENGDSIVINQRCIREQRLSSNQRADKQN
jgi:type I restriction enzyme, S subunit